MYEKKGMNIKKYYGLFAAGIVGVIYIISYFLIDILPGQENVIMGGDLYAQCVPFAKLLVQKIFSDEYFYYSKLLGMGGTTVMVFAFYAMSPLNILYLIPNELLSTVLITVLKPMIAAFCFQLFCRYELKCEKSYTIYAGAIYGLCGYGLGVFRMTSLVDCLYFLPLIFVLVGYFLKTNKISLLMLGYASLFITHFYSGFLIGIASAYYLIFKIFTNQNKKKNIMKIGITYVFCVIVAFLLSAFILFPLGYFVFSRGGTGESITFNIPALTDVISGFLAGTHFEINSSYTYLYSGLVTLLFAPLFFVSSKISKQEKIFTAIPLIVLFASLYIKPLYAFWHMGNDPEGYRARFTFLVSFILLTIAVRICDKEEKQWFQKRVCIFAGVVLILIFLSGLLGKLCHYKIDILLLGINALFIVVWYALLTKNSILDDLQKYKIIIVSVLMLELGIHVFLNLQSYQYMGSKIYQDTNDKMTDAISHIYNIDDKDVYRISSDNILSLNQGCYYDYSDIGFSWASYQENLRNVLSHMGYRKARHAIGNEGSNQVTKLLFANKYNIFLHPDIEKAVVNLYDEYLGIGYMVCDSPGINDFTEDVFGNLEMVASKMTGDDMKELFSEVDYFDLEYHDASLVYQNDCYYIMKNPDTDKDFGYITFRIPKKDGKVAYAYISGATQCSPDEGTHVKVLTEKSQGYQWTKYSLLSTPYIILLNDGDGTDDVYIALESGADYADIQRLDFQYLDENMLHNIYIKLKDNCLNISQYEDGKIVGKVTATKEKNLLFLSIPYEQGWKIYVDETEEKIEPVLGEAFIGCYLTPGEHAIRLEYHAPLGNVGSVLSIIGIIIFFILIFCEYQIFILFKRLKTSIFVVK